MKKLLIFIVLVVVVSYAYQEYSKPSPVVYYVDGKVLAAPSAQKADAALNLIKDIKETSDPKACAKFRGTLGDVSCIIGIAIKNHDYKTCEYLVYSDSPDKSVRNMCMAEYENKYPEVNVCIDMTEDGTGRKDECFYNVAIKLNDNKICNNFTAEKDKSNCVRLVSENSKKP
ncbi:MAG: hypothetical protein WCG97_00730 [bacterium]